jgi:DNA polymerase-3 subunit beta
MKITCNRDKLLQAFQTVAPVAPARSPKPILQNVKMEVADGIATLMATDLEISIRYQTDGVEIDAPGSVVLPVQRFGSILRECTDSVFKLDTDGQNTVIRGERSKFNLPAENPLDFPAIAKFEEAAYYETSARLLKELIRRTVFATDHESSRYALGGVKLEWADGKLTGIGTDGRRLARMEGPMNAVGEPTPFGEPTIVPSKALLLIDRTIHDDDGEVHLAVRQNEILVRSPRGMLSTRLLEGRFPRWRDVFPTRNNAQQVTLSVGPFYSAVRQAAIVTSDESRGVNFTFADGTLTLAGRAAEVGESHIEMPISYDGPAITSSLDPRYLMDFLKVLDGERSFTIDILDGDSAVVCSTDDGFGYVIMPLARDR